MTTMAGPRPGAGTRTKKTKSYHEGTPGLEQRDRVLATLRANGLNPQANDNSYLWFVDCPTHNGFARVRVCAGEQIELACMPLFGDAKCEQPQLVRAMGLTGVIEVQMSALERLRAALVDSAGLDNIPAPEPLVDGILQLDSIAWLQGKPGHGKSFLALDMAGCIGTGNPWQSFHVKQGRVLYLAAEGVSGVRQRVRAWEGSMGVPMAGVSFLPVTVQATSSTEWDALVALADEQKPAMVVIDTQARVTVGMDENGAKDMGEFVERVEQIRRATGACVLVVHHEGRSGEHMRGSTAIEGAATTIIRAVKDDDEITVSCPKQKDAPPFETLSLRVVPYEQSAVICLNDLVRRSTVLTGQEEKLVSVWRETFETDQTSVAKLTEVSGIARATVYRAVNKLVKLGMVERSGTENRPTFRIK